MPLDAEGLRFATSSGAGSSAPVAPFDPSCTRYVPPAGTTPVSGATPVGAAVPVAERYCTLQPATDTSADVGLYSSTNLLRYGAPAEPPAA